MSAIALDACYACDDPFIDPVLAAVNETMLIQYNVCALLAASYVPQSDVVGNRHPHERRRTPMAIL